MSDLSNDPDECQVCEREYDLLLELDEGEEAQFQTQGKANVCHYINANGTHVFFHFAEKWL